MSDSGKVVFASRASRIRWVILATIVGFAFSADYLLKRDISNQVGDAWMDSCTGALPNLTCASRRASHHDACFDLSYTSMIFTFGRARWESFKLIDYEACMNREVPPNGVAPVTNEAI